MKKNDNNADDSLKSPGFSERFNLFLDEAGFPEFNSGRIQRVSEIAGMSVSGVRKWVVGDLPPRSANLISFCSQVIKSKLADKYNPKRIACWLEYGDEIIPNPFISGQSILNDHALMGNLYILVHGVAKELGIDIYTLDAVAMDTVYNTLMDEVVHGGYEDPDTKVIAGLLFAAKKESARKRSVKKKGQ